jgi:hypothetical protein
MLFGFEDALLRFPGVLWSSLEFEGTGELSRVAIGSEAQRLVRRRLGFPFLNSYGEQGDNVGLVAGWMGNWHCADWSGRATRW